MPDLDLEAVDDRLRQILRRHAGGLSTTRDSEAGLSVEIPGHEGTPQGFVAGTRVGKRYVSYYLMPVYAHPELVEAISPELRARMQGKSCFNFSRLDDRLFGELEELTARGLGRGPIETIVFPEHQPRAERDPATSGS